MGGRSLMGVTTMPNALARVDMFPHCLQIGGHTEDTVATLNVKNLPDSLYRRLKARAKNRRRSVAQEVTDILTHALSEPEPLSILGLKGLGKDMWEGIDAAAYVNAERDEWD